MTSNRTGLNQRRVMSAGATASGSNGNGNRAVDGAPRLAAREAQAVAAGIGLTHPAKTPRPAALGGKLTEGGGELSGKRRAPAGASSGYVANLPDRNAQPFVRLEGQARLDAAVPCLKRALELVTRRDGWCKGSLTDSSGRCSLQGALQASGTALEGYFAREVLRRILHETDFTAWNDHPFRVRADVVRLLRAGLKACGAHARRGGWTVGGSRP